MPTTIPQLLDLARSGMLARLADLDAVSANLANANTTGYKRGRLNFQELLDDRRAALDGTQTRATQRLMDQGQLRQTGRPFDLAVDGEGFFAVRLPDGRTAYTRDGQFQRDANGQLVSVSGYPLVWDGHPPKDAEEFHVNPDGTVMVKQGEVWSQAGQVPLTRFANPSGLNGYGQNLWLATDVSGAPIDGEAGAADFGQIVGSALESSNVNLADEMTHLLTLQRAYGLSVRAFQQTDQMLGLAIQMRRG
ncbi:MAG: flagellar hook-basal body complex protein [Chloroflexi bacterium]|nr:flagellar hook-basal body complex protein [Chloroflexota bacterium]